MTRICYVRKETSIYAPLHLCLPSLCLLAMLLVTSLAGLAQGGPPLLTDDPGTPGRNNWEINLGYTIDRHLNDNDYETPILDMNYGWGDRVQLNYEMPYLYAARAARRSVWTR